MFHVPEKYRFYKPGDKYHSTPAYGNNGKFFIPRKKIILQCMASDGEGWEHVSVSTAKRCPNWPEMCFIKELFWDDEDLVVQYHPAKSNYINVHPHCLHLWRPVYLDVQIPVPPLIMV